MGISLLKNIAALQAGRQLGQHSSALSKVYERLSSGLRINHASDDAAGLSLALTLNNDRKVLGQASRNTNDAISLLTTAQGALDQLSTIVSRQKELAEQAANGTFTTAQRTAINAEAQALASEYSRIVDTTTFNGIHLLDNTAGTITIQVGLGSSANDRISFSLGALLAGSAAVGTGTFAAATSYAAGSFPVSAASGDFNGDGVVDLFVGASGSSNGNLLLGNGDGSFKIGSSIPLVSGNTAISSADLNGDGFLDIVAGRGSSPDIAVILGNGDGTFKVSNAYTAGGVSRSMTLGDVNGDGRRDIVTADYGTGLAYVLIGNSDGSFKAATNYTLTAGQQQTGVALADFNGDGKLDLVSSERNLGDVRILLGNGDGSFKSGTAYTVQSLPSGLTAADFNGDGYSDLVVTNRTSGSASVLLGNGDGSFKAASNLSVGGTSPSTVIAGDLNGDGNADFVTANYGSGNISIFLGNGNGTFSLTVTGTAGNKTLGLLAADFTGDGVNDLAFVRGESPGSIGLFVANTTTGNASTEIDLSTAAGAQTALSTLDSMASRIAQESGNVSAYLSRFTAVFDYLSVTRENLSAAQSRIMDSDIAAETAEMIRLQVLQQATTAVLAHAQLNSHLVLKLLK